MGPNDRAERIRYFRNTPPSCLEDVRADPSEPPGHRFGGHGVSGRYPDALEESPTAVFHLRCKACDSSSHRVRAIARFYPIRHHHGQVECELMSVECCACHGQGVIFDTLKHGYNIALFLHEGIDVWDVARESPDGPLPERTGEALSVICTTCLGGAFDIWCGVEQHLDRFDEPSLGVKPEDLFSWYSVVVACTRCGAANTVLDQECA